MVNDLLSSSTGDARRSMTSQCQHTTWVRARQCLLLFALATFAGPMCRGAESIDFRRDIQPILQTHCYSCHGAEKHESGYRMDRRDIAMRGGDSGQPAIVAGNAEQSPLLRVIRGDDELLMPPADSGQPRLTADEIAKIQQWITAGAIWPDDLAGTDTPKTVHWSLQPILKPDITASSEHPLDRFVTARLSEHDLSLSKPTDRRTLIRRVTFDLTGLPPTREEIASFVNDASPRAYEQLVDRLLDSPHYGERWGRHWLDVARYTESQGFEYDRLRDHAWHYRDYVIKSFNDDKPYDQFMREQIAGDVWEPITSEGIVATSLLVCGPWDQAGNGQSNATQRAITREDELEDLIGVVCQSFLGLTVNCARCHSHKFDPIPQQEYYQIKSVFEGVKHGERSILSPTESAAQAATKARIEQEIAAAQREISRIETIGWRAASAATSDQARRPGPTPWARWNFDGSAPSSTIPGSLEGGATIEQGALQLAKPGAYFQTEPLPRDIREKTLEAWVSLANLDQRGGGAIAMETLNGTVFDAITFAERQPRRWMAGSDGFQRTRDLEASDEDAPPDSYLHVAITYEADGQITLYRNGERYGSSYRPAAGLQAFLAGQARVVLGRRHEGGGSPWLTGAIRQASLYDRALSAAEVADSYQSNGMAIPHDTILAHLSDSERAARDVALATIERAKVALTTIPNPGVSYVGTRVEPAPTRFLPRGDVKSPQQVVTPGALSAIASIDADFHLPADAPEAQRRIAFARWLTDPQNPLPARVIANRLWQHHFGQGLVTTPNDLGSSGARPTHPELLDWLAATLIENRWSLKSLHRLIVSSNTYQQASDFDERAAQIDADNGLMWRFSPRRLEAEAVRDAMLAVSGRLNPQVGGPSFRGFTTSEFNATFYHPTDRDDPEFNRRTVYRFNVNSGKDPLLDAFDCPDPSVKTPRRGVTTTPLQALELMNHPFVQRMATSFRTRVVAESHDDMDRAILIAYELALGREPTKAEFQRGQETIQQRGLTSLCWALLNSTEFIYVR